VREPPRHLGVLREAAHPGPWRASRPRDGSAVFRSKPPRQLAVHTGDRRGVRTGRAEGHDAGTFGRAAEEATAFLTSRPSLSIYQA